MEESGLERFLLLSDSEPASGIQSSIVSVLQGHDASCFTPVRSGLTL